MAYKDQETRRAYEAANRDKARAHYAAWRDRDLEMYGYKTQKTGARVRGIPFLLTFNEWRSIWRDSGKFAERGRRKGQYVMARHGDVGPYSIDNVKIVTCNENIAEARIREGKRGPYGKRRHV